MVPAIVSFTITITEGDIELLETVYKQLVGAVRKQQLNKMIDAAFQTSLSTCAYHKNEIMPKVKKDPSFVYNVQPPPFAGEHYLIATMEQALPGITIAESGANPIQINPGQMPMMPPPVQPAPVQPVPAAPGLYPDFSLVFNPAAEVAVGPNIYPGLAPPIFPEPAPVPAIPPCSSCKNVMHGEEITPLLCGHHMHVICIMK